MRVTPIASPLPGEHLAATFPIMRPETVNAQWRLRLHFWAGRSLTHDALDLEQTNRGSQLAWRGRLATPGIVTGLDVALESSPGSTLDPIGHFVHVLPGHGFLADGEDVVIPRPLRVPLTEIPVDYVRITHPFRDLPVEPTPAGAASGESIDVGGFVVNVDRFPEDRDSVPRRRNRVQDLSWAAVLVLAPAEIRMFAREDPRSPCELDLSRDAFADERRLDTCELRLCQLPLAWQLRPELTERDSARWRNRLAHVVLSEQARVSARQQIAFLEARPERPRWITSLRTIDLLPWEVLGVPLAILSSERAPGAAARSYFLDRASVVRSGGRARTRSRPSLHLATGLGEAAFIPGNGTPFDWRARVDQFAEHLGDLATANAENITALETRVQFLPPVGFLPRPTLDLIDTAEARDLPRPIGEAADRAGVNHLFPPTVHVEAVPVAIEDLDAALASSAGLEPFDLASTREESVRMLVPLPQRVFDPNLLIVEEEDPLFATTVARMVATRQDWRQRRDIVRDHRDDLQEIATGRRPPAVPLDPGQIEPEPVETLGGLGFTRALLSPSTTNPPWNVSIAFAAGQPITPESTLLLWLRPDLDARPSRIDVTWRSGDRVLRHSFTAEIPVPTLEPGGNAPIPLWQPFTVAARDLDVTATMAIDAVTLHLEGGRLGLLGVGEQRPSADHRSPVETATWWRAEMAAPVPQFEGGDWTSLTTSDQLLAPFEATFEPVFADQTLINRLEDLDTQLRLTGDRRVRQTGLAELIARVEREVNQADDAVDLDFLKAQSNIHRIRQVMLGEDVANQLLTSPTLGSVVKQQSARVAQDALINTLKSTPNVEPPAGGGGGGGGVIGGGAGGGGIVGTIDTDRFGRFETIRELSDLGGMREVRASANVRASSFIVRGADLASAVPVRDDVLGAEPAIGKPFELRTLTIAKRFDDGPTRSAYDYADAELRTTVARIVGLQLEFDDGDMIPEVRSGAAEISYGALARGGRAVLNGLQFPSLGTTLDSSAIFGHGVRRADTSVLILRRLEFYIARKREQLRRAREVLAAVSAQHAAASARVLVIEGKLAEARHDVSVARALRQEEQQRVNEINERRDGLIRDEVKFVAYVRPRTVDLVRRHLAYWKLDPASVPAPVPACLQRHDEPPVPLHAYVQLCRHAPARWFAEIMPLIARLTTTDKLMALLEGTRTSAASFTVQDTVSVLRGSSDAVQFTVLGARQVIGAMRQRSTLIQILEKRRWQELLRDAEEHASVGDLITGRHGSPDVSTAAAGELELIGRVATCLHAEFAAVAPAIRLLWIERFSQFDRPAVLRDLTVLPQYGRLDRHARRRLQEFVDWLFMRVRPSERDAQNLMNDLVRLCLLLASHAPVNRIIAGHVPRPTLVRPGLQIPIRPLNPELVRVGMEFHVWQASRVVARGRVEDLHESEVSARVDHVEAQTTTIDPTMRVQFVAAGLSFSR